MSQPSAPLTLAMVVACRNWGGLQKHTLDLTAELSLEHRVVAVADPDVAHRFHPRVQVEPVAMRRSRLNPLLYIQISRALRRHRPALSHAQGGKAAAILARLPRSITGARVATVHNMNKVSAALRRFDAVIAVSRTVANQLQGLPVHVIYNGSALPDISRQHSASCPERSQGRPLTLAAGRLVAAKGFDTLIEAWAGIDADLWIAGDGPEAPALQAQIDRQGLGSRVQLLGRRTDVLALIDRADLVVISSRREGFSYVLLEALQLGTPVLATRVPVACELLPNDFLVPPEDAPALREHLLRILDQPAAARAAQAHLFQEARTNLTVQAMATQTQAVYRSLSTLRAGSGANQTSDGA